MISVMICIGPEFVLESQDVAGVLGQTDQLDLFRGLSEKNLSDIVLT